MAVQSVYVEKLQRGSIASVDTELLALDRYFGKRLQTEVFRFTFISQATAQLEAIPELRPDSILGLVVIVNAKYPRPINGSEWLSYVFEAFWRVPALPGGPDHSLLNNYVHLTRTSTFRISLPGNGFKEFSLQGTHFCQQNGVTSRCAQAALCMLLNNRPTRDPFLYPEDINRILGLPTAKYPTPQTGLTHPQVVNVVKKVGLDVVWENFIENPNSDYAEYLYRHIESRFPSLLIFFTKDSSHVVPVLGHTFNSDMWKAEAELAYSVTYDEPTFLRYKPASAWVDHFIIHDDNYGMYLCLALDSLRRITLPKYDQAFRAAVCMTVVPRLVTSSAREAEVGSVASVRKFLDMLSNTRQAIRLPWLERLSQEKVAPWVARTLFVSRGDYARHLRSRKDFEGAKLQTDEIDFILRDTPKSFWLTEVSLPDLYTGNKSKLIDVLHPPTTTPEVRQMSTNIIEIVAPGVCFKFRGKRKYLPLSTLSHFPLFRFDLKPPLHEW